MTRKACPTCGCKWDHTQDILNEMDDGGMTAVHSLQDTLCLCITPTEHWRRCMKFQYDWYPDDEHNAHLATPEQLAEYQRLLVAKIDRIEARKHVREQAATTKPTSIRARPR